MKIIGIVAEYNPFHNGHLYHIQNSRALVAPQEEKTSVISLMSGNFVQRGRPAVFRKQARAIAALRKEGEGGDGADLVLELPLTLALSSAEGFARGAVSIFEDLGAVSHISFGAESGSLADYWEIAESLDKEAFSAELKSELGRGISFAAARQRVLLSCLGDKAELLSLPNNILAAEYVKALKSLQSSLSPLLIRRRGGGYHDENSRLALPSATAIRGLIEAGDGTWREHMPQAAALELCREIEAGRGPVTLKSLELPLLSRLRMLKESDFDALPYGGEGLGGKLMKNAGIKTSIEDIIFATKSKRYAHSRIARMLMCAALGLDRQSLALKPPYVRVLAFNDRGREVLALLRGRTQIPLISKNSAIPRISEEAGRYFELERSAADFYSLGYPELSQALGGEEWRQAALYFKSE